MVKIGKTEVTFYSLSIHLTLFSLLWAFFAVLWAYIKSVRSTYFIGIELNRFFYFPSFLFNKLLSGIFHTDLTQNLLAMGGRGIGLVITENICLVYLLSLTIALGFVLFSKRTNGRNL